MWRFWVETVLLAALGVALGLGVAWVEKTYGIPKIVVQWFWIVTAAAALGFAVWVGWRYYVEGKEDDDWD